jgi:hypothetical protein
MPSVVAPRPAELAVEVLPLLQCQVPDCPVGAAPLDEPLGIERVKATPDTVPTLVDGSRHGGLEVTVELRR